MSHNVVYIVAQIVLLNCGFDGSAQCSVDCSADLKKIYLLDTWTDC